MGTDFWKEVRSLLPGSSWEGPWRRRGQINVNVTHTVDLGGSPCPETVAWDWFPSFQYSKRFLRAGFSLLFIIPWTTRDNLPLPPTATGFHFTHADSLTFRWMAFFYTAPLMNSCDLKYDILYFLKLKNFILLENDCTDKGPILLSCYLVLLFSTVNNHLATQNHSLSLSKHHHLRFW